MELASRGAMPLFQAGLVASLVLGAGCGPNARGADDDGTTVDAAIDGQVLQPPGDNYVWAHTNRRLYRVDPATLMPTDVGAIVFSTGINQLTDLAVDHAGGVVGVSTRELYRIDKTTAAATLITTLTQPYNGLSYVDSGSGEQLLGTTQTGELWRIDTVTGVATRVGAFGDGLTSSGDVVFVYGAGLLATVARSDWTTDRLARIDPSTGAATIIGDTGFENLFGVGYWGGRVVAFSEKGDIVTIDPTTGKGTVVARTGVAWWGAGVTTTAPVIL